jgi:hypothetical protein
MDGQKDLNTLLKTMRPKLNPGEYVFCVVDDLKGIDFASIILFFKEQEGNTIIITRELADSLNLSYSFIASWITLTVHSSLEAIGLTAAFSKALTDVGISCNVVAAFYHDHIFVDSKHTEEAIKALNMISEHQT